MVWLLNSGLFTTIFTSSTYSLVYLQYANTKLHHASNCFSRVSKFGWMVKNGGKLYCHGHSNFDDIL